MDEPALPFAWMQVFCDLLANDPDRSANISACARAAGVKRSVVEYARKRFPQFNAAVDDALEEAYDAMEAESRRRAFKGVETPVYQGGNLVGHVQKYSDTMATFLLKGYRRKAFGDSVAVTGADGGPVQVDSVARAARVAQLMDAAKRRKAGQTDDGDLSDLV